MIITLIWLTASFFVVVVFLQIWTRRFGCAWSSIQKGPFSGTYTSLLIIIDSSFTLSVIVLKREGVNA